jgi:hypothetical protein
MDDLLDAGLSLSEATRSSTAARTAAAKASVEGEEDQKMLLERMQKALLEKNQTRLAELESAVEAQGEDLELLSTQFSDGAGPPEGWRPEHAPEAEEEESEDEGEDDEETAGAELFRVLERPQWKL